MYVNIPEQDFILKTHELNDNLFPNLLLQLGLQLVHQLGSLEPGPLVHVALHPLLQLPLDDGAVGGNSDLATEFNLTSRGVDVVNIPSVGFPSQIHANVELHQKLAVLQHVTDVLGFCTDLLNTDKECSIKQINCVSPQLEHFPK